MYTKEGVSLQLNFGNPGESKLSKNQTEVNRAVFKEKLGCGIVPCLNHGKCTVYPFSRLGFLCVCPPGFYGDFCQHRSTEPVTVVSLFGAIAIPILILALCFAICCICNKERLHHQAFKKNPEISLNPSPATCKSKSPRVPCPQVQIPCPRTNTYQKSCKRRDNINPFEPENIDFLQDGTRNDPHQYNPELTATQSSVANCQRTNEVERSTGSRDTCPAMKKCSVTCQTDPEAIDRKSHIRSKSPSPAMKQRSIKCQTDPEAVDRKVSTSHNRSKSPSPAVKQCSVTCQTDPEDVDRKLSPSHIRSKSPSPENKRVEATEEGKRISSPSINHQDSNPVANQSSVMENECTEVAEKKETSSRTRSQTPCSEVARKSTSSARSQCPRTAELQSEQPMEGRRTSLSSMKCVPCPDNQLIKGAEEGSQIHSTYDPCLDYCSGDVGPGAPVPSPRCQREESMTWMVGLLDDRCCLPASALCVGVFKAYEFNCLKESMPDAHEDSECRTRTVRLSDQMFVEECDAECQCHYPASRKPSEDCEYSSNNAPCLDEVQQTSNFQSKSGEIIPCNDMFEYTTSSQSSYHEHFSPLPTDSSTPRSESSSQMSSSSEIVDDFGNKSEYSLNSSISSEALLNLLQSFFGSGDDVKSVKISILMDNSQSDDSSNSTNVKETINRISYQMNSPLSSEGHSEKGLQNNCYFLNDNNTLSDVESSMASFARNHTNLESELKSLNPTMVNDSIDCCCAKDKEPCSKTTTVRYMFTDSETEA